MAKHVFILGAGASVDAGAPVMRNFINTADDLFVGACGDYSAEALTVRKLRSDIQSVFAKSNIDIDNIESLLGAVEMAKIIGVLGKYTTQEIDSCRDSLVKIIAGTIEQSIKFPIDQSSYFIRPTDSYDRFARCIRENQFSDCAIISFNYDIALEVALSENGVPFNYGLSAPPKNKHIPYLKLHGSVHWTQCPGCGEILHDSMQNILAISVLPGYKSSPLCMDKPRRRALGNHKCPKGVVQSDCQPLLVPPTWTKTSYHHDLINVWNRAAIELANAAHIYVIGYSWPESDSFFHYLYALGTMSDTLLRGFSVYDPNPDLEFRYRNLLGGHAIDKFHFTPITFREFVTDGKLQDIMNK